MSPVEQILMAVERHRGSRLLLVMAFDGVLVEYERDPRMVHLPAALAASMNALGHRRDVSLCMISGRRLADLRQRADIGAEAFYIGLHGLEVDGPGYSVREREAIDTYRDRVHDIALTLAPSLLSTTGIIIEDKEAAVAVHTRQAGAGDAVWARHHLLSTAAGLVRQDELRVVRGNHVLELIPNIGRPRAAAITGIRRYLEDRDGQSVFILYVGEDVPEDDAVDAIDERGLYAVVGNRGKKARFHLSSTAEVRELIDRLTASPDRAA